MVDRTLSFTKIILNAFWRVNSETGYSGEDEGENIRTRSELIGSEEWLTPKHLGRGMSDGEIRCG